MNREFLDLFNQELGLLKEQAREFADDYPGIAARLGGLIDERPDNMVLGLLEGAAFLAARVQLKLKHEFPEFTNNLLEQLVPNYLAPTPSVMLVKVVPPYGDPALRAGIAIPRGSAIDATHREREGHATCRFRLTSDITLWPFDIEQAEYLPTSGAVQKLGIEVGPEIQAGLRIRVAMRAGEETGKGEDMPPDRLVAGCRATELPIRFLGDEADAAALYELLVGSCNAVFLRSLDAFGNTVKPVPCFPPGSILQIGLGEEDDLLPNDGHVFHGFDLLRDYFVFPRKFLGIRLVNLGAMIRTLRATSFDLVFTLETANPRMAAAVAPERFALYAAPAVNLFTKDMDRIPVRASQHEYHVVPDRSRSLDFEPHRILEVNAHYPGGGGKERVPPLYSTRSDGTPHSKNLFYTLRRLPRRATGSERRQGMTSDYMGTDVFLSLVEPAAAEATDDRVMELSVKALCSNRHLPEHLPVRSGGADFQLLDKTELAVLCVEGPTPPREAVLSQLRGRSETAHTGVVAWRLVNILALNHLGLVERGGGRNGQALRDILAMFADMGDSTMEKRIRGVRSVDSRPVVRRIRRPGGVGAARGIEITVTLDDRAYEGSGAFLLGAVLDRFFAEYAAINSFTQTVIRTAEWGRIMCWPARLGLRGM